MKRPDECKIIGNAIHSHSKQRLYIRKLEEYIDYLETNLNDSDKNSVIDGIIIAEQSGATVCPLCTEFQKTHGKDSECIPCGLKRLNNRQTG